MNITSPSQVQQFNATDARRRQVRAMQLVFAGAAAIAMLAFFDLARPDTTQSLLSSGSVRLVDQAVPAPASGPGGFATDDSNDQAQQQEQLAMQEIQQAEQQAEQQNEAAQQQATQDELQAQQTEQQANNP
jgi:hypothetical protein